MYVFRYSKVHPRQSSLYDFIFDSSQNLLERKCAHGAIFHLMETTSF